MFESREDYIFPDHHGLLTHDGRSIEFKRIEAVYQELMVCLEDQKRIDLLINEFVVWGNDLLLRHIGPSFPIQLKRIARPIEASYINAHLSMEEPVLKYQITWKTRVKPVKMISTAQLFSELVNRRFSIEERWLYWFIERQRILVMSRVNEVKEALLLKATEYDSLMSVDDSLPFKPVWLQLTG